MKLWQSVLGQIGKKGLSIDGKLPRLLQTWPLSGDEEPPSDSFEFFAEKLFAANPVVFGAERVRKAVASQGRFRWRDVNSGRFFGNQGLSILETPWPGGSTQQLLTKMVLHGDLGGTAYVLRLGDRLHLLRPDWVTVILGSRLEPDHPWLAEDVELVGYMYMPRGPSPGRARDAGARIYMPSQVGRFVPNMPDPMAHFRGMSWLTPVVREVMADKATVSHKLKFFENAATPNMIVKFDASQTINQVKAFKELVEEEHRGVADAYRTLYLGGGAEATVVGADLNQLDFARTVGKAETRILMAAGVHPVIAGASEGMQGASLNAGNFKQIRRLFSDVHLQDLWMEAATALSQFVDTPPGAELAVDGRDIPFVQDDQIDRATISRENARALTQLWRDGAVPETAIAAVDSNDLGQLRYDDRFRSVQLQQVGGNAETSEEIEEGA